METGRSSNLSRPRVTMDVNLIVEHQPETTIAFQDSDPTMPAEIDTKEVTDEQQTDAALLNLAPELLHRILVESGKEDLTDLASLAATCRQMRRYVYENPDKALWREIHRSLYDDPNQAASAIQLTSENVHYWQGEVCARHLVELACCGARNRSSQGGKASSTSSASDSHGKRRRLSKSKGRVIGATTEALDEEKEEEFRKWTDKVATTLVDVLDAIPPRDTDSPSRNLAYLDRIMRSDAFEALYRQSYSAPAAPHRYPLRAHGATPATAAAASAHRHPQAPLPHPGLARVHTLRGWCTQEAEERALERQMLDQYGSVNTSFLTRNSEYLRALGRHRAVTYSMRNFSRLNEFGPFRPDGSTNWPLVDAIAATMDANVTYVKGHSRFRHLPFNRWEMAEWRCARPPSESGIESSRPKSLRKAIEALDAADGAEESTDETEARTSEEDTGKDAAKSPKDWAGVEGIWRGTYAFMDYTDFIQYNWSNLAVVGGREPVDINTYVEAVGNYMRMDLKFGLSGEAANLPQLQSNLPISETLPAIQFCGSSTNGSQVRVSEIRGQVSLTTDDPPQVRWTWIVRYGGEDRWRLEGIQIGGIGSKRGVVGMWSDVDRADLSPVGPFWYWQVDPEEEAAAEAALTALGGEADAGGVLHVDVDDEIEFETDSEDEEFMIMTDDQSEEDPDELEDEPNPAIFMPPGHRE